MVQQPIPPRPSDPNDDNVEDDSLLRPITTPPERDRAQAAFGDQRPGDDLPPEVAQDINARNGSGMAILPIAIVAIIVIALLWWWLM